MKLEPKYFAIEFVNSNYNIQIKQIPVHPGSHLQKNPSSLSSHCPLELQVSNEHFITSLSQVTPYHPGWHWQSKWLLTMVQDPPLLHGSEEQSTIGFVPWNELYL